MVSWKINLMLTERKGFTLIEIISVLVILSILGSVVLSRVVDSSSESASAKDVIKSHIRYAQIMAMESNEVCGISFTIDKYSIFRNNSVSDKITLPGNDGTDFSIPKSLGTAQETIYFDLWGTPYTTLSLTKPRRTGSIGSLDIYMTADTGYIK